MEFLRDTGPKKANKDHPVPNSQKASTNLNDQTLMAAPGHILHAKIRNSPVRYLNARNPNADVIPASTSRTCPRRAQRYLADPHSRALEPPNFCYYSRA